MLKISLDQMGKKEMSPFCRVCLTTDPTIGSKCLSLFDRHRDTVITDCITSIAYVEIKEGDGLPSKICLDCMLELDAAIKFKIKCETSNVFLQTSLLNTDIIKTETHLDPVDNIIKEEPQDSDHEMRYHEDFLADDDKFHEYQYKEQAPTCLDDEIKPEESKEVDSVNLIQKSSRAINLELECSECGEHFKSKFKLRGHWKKVHFLESLICKICKRAFKSYGAYDRHVKKKARLCTMASNLSIEGVGKSRVFKCNKCTYSAKKIEHFKFHLNIHTGYRPYSCDLCSKTFTQLNALYGHKEGVHRLYRSETICQHCGQHLKGRQQIYKHMKGHSSYYVQCAICNKKFKCKTNLISHLRRHSGVNTFTCEYCAQSFYSLTELCHHRQVRHEKDKYIYKCDICEYKTYTSAKIKRHKAGHTETNIPCLECGVFVKEPKQLKAHQRRHFSERDHECPFCEKKFMDNSTCKQHIKNVHKVAVTVDDPIKNENIETPTVSNKVKKVTCKKKNKNIHKAFKNNS